MNVKTRRELFEIHCRGRVGVSFDYTAFTAGIDEGMRCKQDEVNNLKAQLISQRYLLSAANKELEELKAKNEALSTLNRGLLNSLNCINDKG